MRKISAKAALLFAAIVMFASCEKVKPTALNAEDVVAESTICGFVRYAYVDGDNKTTFMTATNVDVRIECIAPVTNPDGTEGTATRVVMATTDGKGYYTANVAVPMGKTTKCNLLTHFEKRSYAINEKNEKSEQNCVFEAVESNKSVAYGQTLVVKLDAAKVGVVSNAGF